MSRRRRDRSPPEAFEFFIGGHMGTSHRVVWEGGHLRYERFGSNTFRAFLRAVRNLAGVDGIA
jgi:hypothetical protein